MAGKSKKEFREAKEKVLKRFYDLLPLSVEYKQAGDMERHAKARYLMCECLEELYVLRAQEVMGSWPQLLPAAPVH